MWQKARIIKVFAQERALGRYAWVFVKPPRRLTALIIGTDRVHSQLGYDTNVDHVPPLNGSMQLAANQVELLPEFAEDVPMITWEEFLRD